MKTNSSIYQYAKSFVNNYSSGDDLLQHAY